MIETYISMKISLKPTPYVTMDLSLLRSHSGCLSDTFPVDYTQWAGF